MSAAEESGPSLPNSDVVDHKLRQQLQVINRIALPAMLCPYERIRAWKCFDADTGKDMAREIREYLIPDFSAWKDHDRFEAEFKKLLRDLRANAATAA